MAEAGTNTPIQQAFFAQAAGIPAEQYKQMVAAQQQQALAQALLQEGETPISTNNRMMGNIAYKISPFEGLAKMAQILSGKEGLQSSNEALANALYPQSSQDGMNIHQDNSTGTPTTQDYAPTPSTLQTSSAPQGTSVNPWVDAQGNPTRMANMQAMMGNRAGAEMTSLYAKPFQAAPTAYGTGIGTAAAGQAAPGAFSPNAATVQPQPVRQPNPYAVMPSPQGMPAQPQSNTNAGIPQPTSGIQIPPMNASQLTAHQSTGGSIQPPPAMAAPNPANYTTNDAYQAAMKAFQAGATKSAEAAGAGAATQAEDTGKNIADATKTFNVAAGNLPRAMQRFQQLRQASNDASYGGGVSEEEPGSMIGDYARNFARTSGGQLLEPHRAIANQTIEQATKQGILSELGPQLAGLRGNKFLETIASGASGLNAADPPLAKINAINGLQDQYISNLKSLAQQRRSYGDPTAPSEMDLAKIISQNSLPTTMVNIITPDGKFGKVSVGHLSDLVQSGGQIK